MAEVVIWGDSIGFANMLPTVVSGEILEILPSAGLGRLGNLSKLEQAMGAMRKSHIVDK
jgi:hypothetical protein